MPFFLGFRQMQKQQQQQGKRQKTSDISKLASFSSICSSWSWRCCRLLSFLRSSTASNHICLAMSFSASSGTVWSESIGKGWFPTTTPSCTSLSKRWCESPEWTDFWYPGGRNTSKAFWDSLLLLFRGWAGLKSSAMMSGGWASWSVQK